jgi:putative NADH-flavin reductase
MLLLGANGRTGREIISIAIDLGLNVTAVVRDSQSLSSINHPLIKVVEADVTNPDHMTPLVAQEDVIISTVGPRKPTKLACAIYPKTALAITEATKGLPSKRLLLISTALLFPNDSWSHKLLNFIAKNNASHAKLMEETVMSSSLDWTIARVGFLSDKENQSYQLAVNEMPTNNKSISRRALASFLLNETQHHSHSRQIVGLCDE